MAITERQLDRLARLAAESATNPFLAAKLAGSGAGALTAESFARLPFTLKSELVADQAAHPPYGSNFPAGAHFTRLHQSSGTTTGRPLRWRDTARNWEWLLGCWAASFPLMGLTGRDRAFFPFSFGPFLGFWSAFEAAARHGMFTVSGGGMSSTARIAAILDHGVTVVFATPTYALHLAELAARSGVDLAGSSVRALVVAGEPGGAIPATRDRIEAVWGARVFDHYGLTEVGPVAIELLAAPGRLALLADDYVTEFLTPNGTEPVPAGELGELVVTNLGRLDSPLLRYRTGDLVRAATDSTPLAGVPDWPRLAGGVVGRADDMLHVRGNNVYPSAIEAIVRKVPGVAEYQVEVRRDGALADVALRVEAAPGVDGLILARAVADALRDGLLFRAEVTAAEPGSLPRFEMKARRVITISPTTAPPSPERDS